MNAFEGGHGDNPLVVEALAEQARNKYVQCMSEITDVVVPILQQIQTRLSRVEERIDRLIDDVQDLKVRATHVEEGLAGINRRLDRMDVRMERIERRLDLVDA
jgi:predicted nuclease with TOPRIM domain